MGGWLPRRSFILGIEGGMGEDIEDVDRLRVAEAVVEEVGEDGVKGVERDGSMEVEDDVQDDEVVEATEEEEEVQKRLRAHASVAIEESFGSQLDLDTEEEVEGFYSEEEEGLSSFVEDSTEDISLDQIAEALHGPGARYDIPVLNLAGNRGRGHRQGLQQELHGRALTDRPSMRRSEWGVDEEDEEYDDDGGSSERGWAQGGLGRGGRGRHDRIQASVAAERRSAAWQRPIVGFDVRPAVGQKVIGRVGRPEVRFGIGTIMAVSKDGGMSSVRWDVELGNMREPMQYPSGSFGQYSLELCAPQDLMVGGRYVPSDNPVMFSNRHDGKKKVAAPQASKHSQAGEGWTAAGNASWVDSTVRTQATAEGANFPAMQRTISGVSSKRRGSAYVVTPRKPNTLRLEEERHILFSIFVRFAAGMTRKRFHGYDPRSLVKQKVESMNLDELLLVLEVGHPQSPSVTHPPDVPP